MFYTYVLQSQQDFTFYIGHSSNLTKRVIDHNSGKSRYTRRKMPWNLIYRKSFLTKSEAIKHEIFLKSLKGGVQFYDIVGLKNQRGSRIAG